MKVVHTDRSADSCRDSTATRPTLRLFALLEVIAAKDQRYSLQEPGRRDRAAEAHAAPHAAAARRRRPAAARERRPALRHRRAAAAPGREPAAQRHATTARATRCCASWSRRSARAATSPRCRAARWCTSTASKPRRRCASTCTRARACRCTARPAARCFLAQMTPAQRERLLAHAPLERYTPKTLTDLEQLEREVQRVRKDGYALDDEEFLPGLVCIAVLVPARAGHRTCASRCRRRSMRLPPGEGEAAAAGAAARRRRRSAASSSETDAPSASPDRSTPMTDTAARTRPHARVREVFGIDTDLRCPPSASATTTCPRSTRSTASTPT